MKLRNFSNFIGESEETDQNRLNRLRELGLLPDPLRVWNEEVEYSGWMDPHFEMISPMSFRIWIDGLAFRPDAFPQIEIDAYHDYIAEVSWIVDLNSMTYRIGVVVENPDIDLFHETRTLPEKIEAANPTDTLGIIETALYSLESYCDDGPVLNGLHRTELYDAIVEILKSHEDREEPEEDDTVL